MGDCFNKLNQFGFVSTPKMDSVAKPPGRIRIAFLGESSTAGMGVILRDVDTWPYQTWVLLRKKFPHADIEMINAAAGGYTSFESYGRLWSQVRFFAPDIVIACHGWNEMYYFDDAGPEKMLTRRWKGDGDWSFPPVSLPPRIRPFFLDRYLAWSRLYSALRAVRAARQSPAPVGEAAPTRKKDAELAKTFDPRGVEVFKQNLLLMKAACDLMHAEFYIVKQPTLITPDLPPALREERCFTWYHAFDYETHLRAWQAIYQMIDETFRASNVIDATSLSGKPDLLFDHAHLTPAGSGALAALVAEQLARTSNRWTEVKTKR